MRERVGLLAAYAKRLWRHTSAVWIAWLPAVAVLYVIRSVIGDDAGSQLGLASFAMVLRRAAWRARKPAVAAEPDGLLIVTNPWRTYRLSREEVAGYTWTAPSLTGRDSEPIIALVRSSGWAGRPLVRITTSSGEEAWALVHAVGLAQIGQPA